MRPCQSVPVSSSVSRTVDSVVSLEREGQHAILDLAREDNPRPAVRFIEHDDQRRAAERVVHYGLRA